MTATNLPAQDLSGPQGPTYWRSTAQLAETPEFRDLLDREFPEGVADGPGFGDGVSRRGFLTAVATSIAASGLTSCRKPSTRILPYTNRPEFLIPGIPNHYATALTFGGYGVGALVRSNEGRPTKIEGNPDHPSSLGGSSVWMQGELLNLYDPGRSREPVRGAHDKGAHEHGGADEHGSGDPGSGDPGSGDRGSGDRDDHGSFRAFLVAMAATAANKQGAGLRLLLPSSASPTLTRLLGQFGKALPRAVVHRYDSNGDENARTGAEFAFGKDVDAQVAYDRCRVVASFDADFLGLDGDVVRATKDWSKTRRVADGLLSGTPTDVSRLYVAEAGYSVTGSNADHRFRVAPSQVPVALATLAAELGVSGALARAVASYKGKAFAYKKTTNWVPVLAKDLLANRGKSVVVVGPRQPAIAHALAHAINEHLSNIGKTVSFAEAPGGFGSTAQMRTLVADLNSGKVDTVLAIGCNPILDAPADLEFGAAWAKAKTKVHVGLHFDETGAVSDWHANLAHELEVWGDTVARDGTAAITQPLIAPLYHGISTIEVVAALARVDHADDPHKLVQATWKDRGSDGFDAWWNRALHDGVIAGSSAARINVTLDASRIVTELGRWTPPAAPSATNLELEVRPDNSVLDGRYSNNSWLQEAPDPLTKLTWDNAVLMSRATAMQLGLAAEDGIIDSDGGANVVKLTLDGRSIEGPAWVVPGQADGVVTVTLGYGRHIHGGDVADGAGFDVSQLRSTESMWGGSGLTAAKTGASYKLVSAQDHGSMEGRPLHRTATLAEYQANPSFAPDMSPMEKLAKLKNAHAEHHDHGDHDDHDDGHAHEAKKTEADFLNSLWKEQYDVDDIKDYPAPHQWGMVIDLNSCTGCNSCVLSCTSENNISMVGKDQVAHGREMFWTRMDRYFTTDPDADPMLDDEPGIAHQMVPCMQCENAPCEAVCPVAATVHSPEGLNDMAYNRCIGTRYCNNNCPYKVRRFNWFNFNLDLKDEKQKVRQMAFNPNVTVRARGVMEKCTYCVQRINVAKIHANKEDRMVADGEITPACAQDCPADAITFGNIIDPDSKVSKLRATTLNYGMLSEMNNKPRTTYLGKVTNPNPELVSA